MKSAIDVTVDDLAEAMQTTYVKGRWLYTDNRPKHEYRVLGLRVPPEGHIENSSSSEYGKFLSVT